LGQNATAGPCQKFIRSDQGQYMAAHQAGLLHTFSATAALKGTCFAQKVGDRYAQAALKHGPYQSATGSKLTRRQQVNKNILTGSLMVTNFIQIFANS